ncbi:MAG: hypothetical protein ABSD74_07940 [Rhizomicrobium sp.]
MKFNTLKILDNRTFAVARCLSHVVCGAGKQPLLRPISGFLWTAAIIVAVGVAFPAAAQDQGSGAAGPSAEDNPILVSRDLLEQLRDSLETTGEYVSANAHLAGSRELGAAGDALDHFNDLATLGSAISQDIDAAHHGTYVELSSHTLEAIGAIGSSVYTDPAALEDLSKLGLIRESTARGLAGLSFGASDVTAGVAQMVGSRRIDNVDAVTSVLDGINKTAWGLATFAATGNWEDAKAASQLADLVVKGDRALTEKLFITKYASASGTDTAIVDLWRNAQLAAAKRGGHVQSIEDFYGRDPTILNVVSEAMRSKADAEFKLAGSPILTSHQPDDVTTRRIVENYRETCVGGICVRQNLQPVGGVRLDQVAVGAMPKVRAVVLDSKTGRMILVGDKGLLVHGLMLRDFALALALVYGSDPQDPQFSLDPADPAHPDGKWLKAVYIPDLLQGRSFGRQVFDADFLLKQYGFGVVFDADGHGSQRISKVPGYKSYAAMAQDQHAMLQGSVQWSRFWITVQHISLRQSQNAVGFDVQMAVEAKRQVPDPKSRTGLSDIPTPANSLPAQWARFVSDHYEEFAQESPEFARVEELAKAVGLAKWLKQKGVQIDMQEVAGIVNGEHTPTVSRIGALSATWTTQKPIAPGANGAGGILISKLHMTGGVDLSERPVYAPDNGTTSALAAKIEGAMSAGPVKKLVVTISDHGEMLEAVALSFVRGATGQ